MVKTVLILGGGTGGVVAANVLRKTLAEKHRVVLVDRNEHHYFMASYPLVMVNLRRPEQVTRKLENLQQKGIQFVQTQVTGVKPRQRRVETGEGSLDYDYLVLALGAEHHPETVSGQLGEAYNPYNFTQISRLRQALSRFKRGKIVLFLSSVPYTGVIAPWEIIFLLDAYFRRRGLRHQVKLTLVTPEALPLPLAGPLVGVSLRRMMTERGIQLITQARILSLDPMQQCLLLDQGITVPGDLFIGIPSHWGPSVLFDSGLVVDGGWVEVDPHTLATRASRVYAVGDATAMRLPVSREWAPKAGFFAHYQAEVVARNIASRIAGKEPTFRYKGKAAGAVMFTDFGKGRLASVNCYAKPSPQVILLRPSKAAYWFKVGFEKYWLHRWF